VTEIKKRKNVFYIYELSHIYENLFAPKLSGERRLDRPFRPRLQSRPKRQQW